MPEPIIILQARTTSSRLPGKVFLDLRGIPLVTLAAKRAANTGLKTVVATSTDPSDDALVALLHDHDVETFRGSLTDVLGRFASAIGNAPDDTPIVRLTGDNVVPDGELALELIDELERKSLDYICTTGIGSGLPYGVSVEVTRAKHIRQADQQATSTADREHVTSHIRTRFGASLYTRYVDLEMDGFRTTVDNLDDYLALLASTRKGQDLVALPWRTWLDQVRASAGAPSGLRPVGDMVLGAAQIGMKYGILETEQPDHAVGRAIVRQAIVEGVGFIDTARAYGSSETVIGGLIKQGWEGRCRIVTKVSPLNDIDQSASPATAAARVENSLLQSSLALGLSQLDVVMLHRASHMHDWDGAVLQTLKAWQTTGKVRDLGVSVQSPEELLNATACDDFAYIQMPYNILDHRWDAVVEEIKAAKQRRPIHIHVRSVLLQGLLTSRSDSAWRLAHVDDHGPITQWLDHKVEQLGCASTIELCIRFVRSLDWIDGVLVGCNSVGQLEENLAYFRKPLLPDVVVAQLFRERPQLALSALDPAQWTRSEA